MEIGEDTLSRSWGITTFFVLAAVVRVAEVTKETVPLVCGQTVPHLPWCCEWVPVVGFARRPGRPLLCNLPDNSLLQEAPPGS